MDQARTLDLARSVDVNWNRAVADQLGESPRRLPSNLGVIV